MIYHSLSELTQRQKSGDPVGIYSVCSANPYVIRAALRQCKADDSLLLIEATSNQVDQFGGYTGMKPADFIQFVHQEAARQGLAQEQLIFGGDHLGPNAWQQLPAAEAMAQARVLIAEYVQAGFSKIHLDTSMRCQDDPTGALAPEIVAQRAAELCKIAEDSRSSDHQVGPVYIIGTEVPIPGGAHEQLNGLIPSSAADVRDTIAIHKNKFKRFDLDAAWERVIAVVVQPGVEFGSDSIVDYQPELTRDLVNLIENQDSLLYEAHSTDYQLESALTSLVADHFAILKVGPQLTYAMREAILALSHIEDEVLKFRSGLTGSNIRSVIIECMHKEPSRWQQHYSAVPGLRDYELLFSLSDRVRYYWPIAVLQSALTTLLANLSVQEVPLSLLSQYFPQECVQVRTGAIDANPVNLIYERIQSVLRAYARACSIYQPVTGENQ